MKATASARAATIIRELRAAGGRPAVSMSLQRFFTEPVLVHGWRTADLCRLARKTSKQVVGNDCPNLLLTVADALRTPDRQGYAAGCPPSRLGTLAELLAPSCCRRRADSGCPAQALFRANSAGRS